MRLAERNRTVLDELGVRPVIQAAGTKTIMGGTQLSPTVAAAMAEANNWYAPVKELNHAIGGYIAGITGAEDALVTSGAASGVVLSMAACVTGTATGRVLRLPDTTGMKNQVILQRIHHGKYSHMYRAPGVTIRDIGSMNECDPGEMHDAIGPNTAAIAFLLGPGINQTGLSLDECAAIARSAQVPLIVDAAAMLPPRRNLTEILDRGADLVTFSGGKAIRGPQASGFLAGRADLVAAARANCSPNHAIGRPHKVSKEQMIGLYTALKEYMAEDEDAAQFERFVTASTIVEALGDIGDIALRIAHDDHRHFVPTVVIEGRRPRVLDVKAIRSRLLNGDPRVFVNIDRALSEVHVSPFSLSPGDLDPLIMRLSEELCYVD